MRTPIFEEYEHTAGAQNRFGRAAFVLLSLLLLLLVAACGKTQVQSAQELQGVLPRPERILVYDFAVSPDEVKLGSGVIPELREMIDQTSRTAQELKVGHVVANMLAQELVKKIRGYGLPAERAAGFSNISSSTLLIEGQLLSINEGNRAERVIIGLGAGSTSVEARVQVYDMTPEGQRQVESFTADAKSGRKPGMAEMMGIGALAGHLLTSAAVSGGMSAAGEISWETVEADAKRMAEKVAEELAQFFILQGWIPANTVR